MPTNKDLKRWFKHYDGNKPRDFARYTKDEELNVAAGTADTSAVNVAQMEARVRNMLRLQGVENISELPAPSEEHFGKIWNIADEFVTTADFVEGAGKTIAAHSNVAIVELATGYKYDVVGSIFDIDEYYKRVQTDALLDEKQDKHDFLRVNAGETFEFENDAHTDVFCFGGTVKFNDAAVFGNFKTFYLAKDSVIQASDAVTAINVDLVNEFLPYTAAENLLFIGFTASNVPIFTKIDKTAVRVANAIQEYIDFTSDPQTQIDAKFDKADVVQDTGDAVDKVISQKTVTEKLDAKADKTAINTRLANFPTDRKVPVLLDETKPVFEKWEDKVWNGTDVNIDGYYVWSDGYNIYYNNYPTNMDVYQYRKVLDVSTGTWYNKTWNNLSDEIIGSYVWTDAQNIYYSNGSIQKVLDVSTGTWNNKTWNGLTNVGGGSVWTDGQYIYYSDGTTQKVLDTATSTWNNKTWNGLTNFNGFSIWTDGQNIYYSFGTTQKVLDVVTSTWNDKIWNGLPSIYGIRIWTDGQYIYYSDGTTQKILDAATSTWNNKTWDGLTSFEGFRIWSDGQNIYYSKFFEDMDFEDSVNIQKVLTRNQSTSMKPNLSVKPKPVLQQSTGTSTNYAMSQKATSDALALKQNKPAIITATLSAVTPLTGNAPYAFSGEITIPEITDNTRLVELVNNDPVLFSKYGFAVANITGTTVTIYTIKELTESVQLTFILEE